MANSVAGGPCASDDECKNNLVCNSDNKCESTTSEPIPPVRIHEIYPAGGNSEAALDYRYVVLYNTSKTDAIEVKDYSLQYVSKSAGAAVNASCKIPTLTIPANSYALITLNTSVAGDAYCKLSPSAKEGTLLLFSVPDKLNTTIKDMAGFKVAKGYVDAVGYGSSKTFEGTGAAPALSVVKAAERKRNPCSSAYDTDDNKNDFQEMYLDSTYVPKSLATPAEVCQ